MDKLIPTPELITDILTRIPEGFIHRNTLQRKIKSKKSIDPAFLNGRIARAGKYLYDTKRLTSQEVQELARWCQPTLPHFSKDGTFRERTIEERQAERQRRIEAIGDPICFHILDRLNQSPGYIIAEDLAQTIEEKLALDELLDIGTLKYHEDLVYDPLRISDKTMQEVGRKQQAITFHRELNEYLRQQAGQTAPLEEVQKRYSPKLINDIMSLGGFSTFTVKTSTEPYQMVWIRPKDSDQTAARTIAEDTIHIKDEAWQMARDFVGDVLRPGARDGNTLRIQVIARSYTVNRAARQLGVSKDALDQAINTDSIPTFTDPEGKTRIAASFIEHTQENPEAMEFITAYETLKARDISLVSGVSYSTTRRRLGKSGISRTRPTWGDVRGRWELPNTYAEYRAILAVRLREWREQKAAERAEQERLLREERERERKHRQELRARLVAAFPTWRHTGRVEQHIALHIGPPNSGKTHDALEALVNAGSGWYLAPLRLLAFEIFDRLNQQGIRCNLLTGEEYIPVEGAMMTAATIEMFNPALSGRCVVIDEAQMLADADRGWAWTRALMESQAPEMHVIAPSTAQNLVEKLAGAAAIPIDIIPHQRLAPIRVADTNWPLHELPPKTILVAFSRRMVLHLKTELENMRRSVSVVYGGLPPEVRRRQADRFADGETEICVATDAVGMGLNLPADRVCFYEVEKFDGFEVRELHPSEVHQIGGRAGRYGIGTSGEIGATTKKDLKVIQQLYDTEPNELKFARVSPTVEDLELIPGSLHTRLAQWAALESIPDSLRDVIKTANLTERIELASMLTDNEVKQLGLDAALKLVNAPTRQNTRAYWYSCAQAILKERYLPLPPAAPSRIASSRDLETAEHCIGCADIYLWLGSRHEFRIYGGQEAEVREERMRWSAQIDEALLHKIDTSRRCTRCGRLLPRSHRYEICDNCHYTSNF